MPPRSIKELKNFFGRKVLLRLDLDVPIENDKVADTFRLDGGRRTLEYLKEGGAKVIIVGHLGRSPAESMEPTARYLKAAYLDSLDLKIVAETVAGMENGQAIVLKNLRSDRGEAGNDEIFTKKLASFGEIYVNESFADSHREHSSIVGPPKLLPGYAGFRFLEEIENLSKVFEPARPFLYLAGGVKAETKIPLLQKMLNLADSVWIGGSLANLAFKVKGYEVGRSLADGDSEKMKEIIQNKKLKLPIDVVVLDHGLNLTKPPETLAEEDKILDLGFQTIQSLGKDIEKAKTVLWNGPLGAYELGYKEATDAAARILANSRAVSVVGGNDTVASIAKLGILGRFHWVSVGGGAMVDFLINRTLPGIEALKNSKPF